MKEINFDKWERKEAFTFFSKMSQPFYSVTFTADVTELYRFTKEHNISFYYALVYLCTKAINQVEAFSYVIRDGKVYQIEQRTPSFTDLKKGTEQFYIVTLPCGTDIKEFCHLAKKKSEEQNTFISEQEETDELIFFTCLPWIRMTAMTNERDFNKDDSVPRIAWGKYHDDHGKKELQISMELNHRLADGVHVGRFYEVLCAEMEQLGRYKETY